MRIGTYTMKKVIIDEVPGDTLHKVIEEMTKKVGDVVIEKNFDGTFNVTAESFVSSKWKEV